jgi:type IV secretory pathway VirB2 component (pilin)
VSEPNLLDDPLAMRRHMWISALRFAAIGVIMAGIAIAYGKIDAPDWLGFVAAIGGMIGFFYAPKFLASRWRSDAGSEPSE